MQNYCWWTHMWQGTALSTLRKLKLSLKLHVHVTIIISVNGHHLRFKGYKNNNRIFVHDSMLPSSVIVSGNNYAKFKLFFFSGLGLMLDKWEHLSALPETLCSTHCGRSVKRYEQCCETSFQGTQGDLPLWGCQNDSPGQSARYCVYNLMEHFTNVLSI